MNIRNRLLLVCFAVALPLICICGLIIWKEYRGLAQTTQRAAVFQDKIAARGLAEWIEAQQAELESIAVLPEIQYPEPELTQAILSTTLKSKRDWNAVFLVNLRGAPVAGSFHLQHDVSLKLRNLEAFKTLIATKRPAISGYTRCPFSGNQALLAVVPVFADGHLNSVLVASIKPTAILRLFSGLGEAQGSVIAVIDENYRVIARTIDNNRWAGKDFSHAKTVQAARKAVRGTFETVGIADPILRTYAFDRLPGSRWLVVVGIPVQSMYGSAYDRLMMMIFLTAAAAVISMALAYRVTAYFTGPINELVREALAIGRGDLTKRVTTHQGGELGLLARAFNQMAINLELNHEHKEMVEKISDSIRQSLDLDQILNTAVTELGQALGASRCCLALFPGGTSADIVGRELEFNYVWWNPQRNGTALKHRSVLITAESMLKLILEQKAILSLDVIEDKVLTPLFDSDDSSPDDWKAIKSLIACPIIFSDLPVGMILVHQCDYRRAWLDLELELVEAVAGQVALAMEHANLYARTRTLAEQEFLINNIVGAIRSSLDTDTILNTVTEELGKALSVDYCQIAQPRPEGPLVITHEFHSPSFLPSKGISLYGANLDFEPDAFPTPDLNYVLGINLLDLKKLAEKAREGSLREIPISAISDVSFDERTSAFKDFLRQIGSRSLIAAPLLQNDRLLGILIVHQCRAKREWQPSEVHLSAAIADQLAVAISHAELFAQVKHQAITDGLTQLYNHVYFKNRLAEELNRAQRKSAFCSLLMLDLDRLKQINDSMGHPVGDAAIRQVASVLKNLLRSGDTAARYGGEEFAIILPDTPLSEALLIAERLRQNIYRNPVAGLGHISVSVGAACYPGHAGGVSELIEKADQALYVAKRGGRNRVCVWSDPHPVPMFAWDENSASAAAESSSPVL